MARHPDGSTAFRKGSAGIGFWIGLEHPDFSKAELNPDKLRRAFEAVADYLIGVILPQVPIRTGQLRQSYKLDKVNRVIGPADTQRWDSKLKNLELAGILKTNGRLNVQLGEGHRRQATSIAKRELTGRKAFVFKGRITLGHAGERKR